MDKKRTVVLLRSVVVISTSYLILFGGAATSLASVGYILALILSNLLLTITPREWFHEPRFSAALLLGDTAVVLVGLYLTVGCFSQDFLIIYFFTIFLTTATESVAQIAVGAAMISSLYGYWLWLTAAHALGASEWLRLPFFFIVAVFYAYVTEETKQERWRRQHAEHERERLRFLLQVSETFSQRALSDHVVRNLAELVESAFPRLECEMCEPPVDPAPTGGIFSLHTHDRTFGALRVATRDDGALNAEEEQFCKVLAMVAANALYAAEQVGVAQEGTRLKQEFLSTLSHELRSPLHVILGNADIIAEELKAVASPFVQESVERLRASGFRLLDVVEELLCFTELRAGSTAVFPERVDLRDLFDDLATSMKGVLASRPIRFEWSVGGDVPAVYTDRRKLRLILNGLLGNAAKFTEEGFVRLGARRVDDQIEIAVQDSGIGIDPQDMPRIFQEFQQIDGSLRRRFDGLGLGLALAQELAGALGGRVDAESQPARGSTFRVRLPLRNSAGIAHGPLRATPLPVPMRRSSIPSAA